MTRNHRGSSAAVTSAAIASAAIASVDVVTQDHWRGRVTATVVGVLFCAAATAGTALFFDLDARVRCESERDLSGVGRSVALRALDAPSAYKQFLYRVIDDGAGYRAMVVVKGGPFVGDAWQRDAEGRVRHHSDVCRDPATVDLKDI